MNGSDLIPILEKIKPNYVNDKYNDLKMDALMYISMHNNKVYDKLKNEYETFKRKYSSEIVNLNKTVTKKKNTINELNKELKYIKTNIKNIVNERVNQRSSVYQEQIKILNDLVFNLKEENESMKDDYENFKTIKKFETIKTTLQKYILDFNDIDELNSFLTDINNKKLLESLFDTDFGNIIFKYHELRINRNNAAHLLSNNM